MPLNRLSHAAGRLAILPRTNCALVKHGADTSRECTKKVIECTLLVHIAQNWCSPLHAGLATRFFAVANARITLYPIHTGYS
ncbi:hypothetical protein AAV94_13190 [Lampropedia cohaerens]|uniref:Uncharacterized protein n=1 Tax=Lampropedia cohaerens TaxID=1610491 RepID=A0A0U1PX47_9BURK|nr:hypothetical protein AAV94_13190 [Lampropedia cohaerens]